MNISEPVLVANTVFMVLLYLFMIGLGDIAVWVIWCWGYWGKGCCWYWRVISVRRVQIIVSFSIM